MDGLTLALLTIGGVIVGVAIFIGVKVSALTDAITAQTTAIGVLTTTVAGINVATPADVTQIQTNTTAVDAAITALGGQPPA